MPFNNKIWESPLPSGEGGGISIDVSIALMAVERALKKLADATKIDISSDLQDISNMSDSLSARFDELTGWVQPDGD